MHRLGDFERPTAIIFDDGRVLTSHFLRFLDLSKPEIQLHDRSFSLLVIVELMRRVLVPARQLPQQLEERHA